MNLRIVLFSIVEPVNDTIRHGAVCDDVEVVAVNCSLAPKSIAQNSFETIILE